MVRKQRKQLKWQQKAKQIKKQRTQPQQQQQSQEYKQPSQQQQLPQQKNQEVADDIPIQQKGQLLIQINPEKDDHCRLISRDSADIEIVIDGEQDQMVQVGGSEQMQKLIMNGQQYQQQIQQQQHMQMQSNQQPDLQQQQLQQQPQQLSTIINQLQKTNPIFERTTEITIISQFLTCPYDNILYACGVTGSGKTTTIINVINQARRQYLFVNCMMDAKVLESVAKYMEGVGSRPVSQNNSMSEDVEDSGGGYQQQHQQHQQHQPCIIIIDQCDLMQELTKLLFSIRTKQPTAKIILISNQNCTEQIQLLHEPTITVFFMPYTDQQVVSIVQSKIGSLIQFVPKKIIAEGVRKAAKKSGDFREMQKYLINWAKIQLNQSKTQANPIPNNIHNFTDPFIQLLQNSILTSSRIKNNILLAAIKSTNRHNSQKDQKKLSCKCKQNQIQKIISQHRSELTKNQCLLYLHEFQQAGLIKIQKTRCLLHNRRMDLGYIKMNINVDTEIIEDIIRKSYYQLY